MTVSEPSENPGGETDWGKSLDNMLSQIGRRLPSYPDLALAQLDELVHEFRNDAEVLRETVGFMMRKKLFDRALPVLARLVMLDELDEDREKLVDLMEAHSIPGSYQDLALWRMAQGSHNQIPKVPFEQFNSSLDEPLDPDNKTTRYHLFRVLYAFEIARGWLFHKNTRRSENFFMRGRVDVERSERQGLKEFDRTSPRFKKAAKHIDAVLPDDLFVNGPPKSVCEIGAAWGGATYPIIDRFKPETYVNFEIDGDLAAQMQRTAGVVAMPSDGESLSGLPNQSMDLVFSTGVFYFVPMDKVWNYLTDMARVCKPGGIVFFNFATLDQMSGRRLTSALKGQFPKRGRSVLSQDHVEQAFGAEFERIALREDLDYDEGSEFIFRKKS